MKKMIEQYVVLDMNGNIIENPEDFRSHEHKLRVYDRERMSTLVTVHSGNLDMDLYAAKACVNALDEYVTPEPEGVDLGENEVNPEEDGENGND